MPPDAAGAAPSGAGSATPIVLDALRTAWLSVCASAHGALAQLGERLLCKHQVIGSIPIGSTNPNDIQFDEEYEIRRCEAMVRVPEGTLFDIVNGFLKSMP